MSRAQLINLERFLGAGTRDPDAPLETVRASFEKLGRLLRSPAEVAVALRALAGVPCERLSAGAEAAADEASEGAVVYLHGGGYVTGSLGTHRGLAARLAVACGTPVWTVGYRLAPEHPFPAAFEDSLAVVEAVLAKEEGPVALVGDSAGGGLVVAVLAALRERAGRLPSAGVCLSPWTDLTLSGSSVAVNAADPLVARAGLERMADLYLDGADPRDPRASPLHADLHGLPPVLVLVGDGETLLDDSTRLVAALEAAGVDATLEVWERMLHVWPLYAPLLSEGQDAIERVARWLHTKTKRAAGSA